MTIKSTYCSTQLLRLWFPLKNYYYLFDNDEVDSRYKRITLFYPDKQFVNVIVKFTFVLGKNFPVCRAPYSTKSFLQRNVTISNYCCAILRQWRSADTCIHCGYYFVPINRRVLFFYGLEWPILTGMCRTISADSNFYS